MKRKPDAMIALISLFFVGLIISGFSSLTVSSSAVPLDNRASFYLSKESTPEEKTVSR